jgi:lipid II:glycine glycyltransferase (peptidoglycan interpeptide bridge formation enzyme)
MAPQASMPHAWGSGGLVAEGPVRGPDLDAIAADLVSLPAVRTTVRPNPLHAGLWASALGGRRAVEIPRCAHVLDLEGGPDQVWKRFHSSARGAVRKAERAGLEIECGTSPRQLDAFDHLMRLSVDRWAEAQNEPRPLARWRARRRDPAGKFARIANAMGDSMRLWVAWRDGAPVASILVLLGANASYTRGAMDKELAGPTSANQLLHWHAIRDACEAGCGSYHMGESGTSTSLGRFKAKLGARPVPYAEYRVERLPLTRVDALIRRSAKRVLRFRDA